MKHFVLLPCVAALPLNATIKEPYLKISDIACMPENLSDRAHCKPTDQGFEQRIRSRFEEIRKIKSRSASKGGVEP